LLVNQTEVDAWSSVSYPTAVQRHARVLAVYERLGLGQSSSSMQVTRGLASLMREKGRVRSADSVMRRMLEPLERGERWRNAPPSLLLEQAQLAHLLNRPDEARAWYRRTLAVVQAQSVPLMEVRARQLFVRTLAAHGDIREARVQLDSLDRAMAVVSNTAFEAARVRAVAAVRDAEGRPSVALAMLDSLLRSRGYPERPKLIEWPDVMRDYALLQFALGDTTNARRAVQLVQSVYATDSVSVNGSHRYAELQLLESRLFARGGDSAAARQSATSARRGLTVALGPEHALTRTAVAWTDSLAGPTLGVTVNRRTARDDVP
jgi:hypothetical protein